MTENPQQEPEAPSEAYRRLLRTLCEGGEFGTDARFATKLAMDLLGADGASATRIIGDEIEYIAAVGAAEPLLGRTMSVEGSFTGSVVTGQQARLFEPSSSGDASQARARQDQIVCGVVAPISLQGRVVGTLGVVSGTLGVFGPEEVDILSDFTEHISLSLELAQTPEGFVTMVDRMPEGVAVVAGGKLVHANPSLVAALGFNSPDELRGAALSAFIPPEDARWVLDLAGDALAHSFPRPTSLNNALGAQLATELVSAHAVLFEGKAALMLTVGMAGRQHPTSIPAPPATVTGMHPAVDDLRMLDAILMSISDRADGLLDTVGPESPLRHELEAIVEDTALALELARKAAGPTS